MLSTPLCRYVGVPAQAGLVLGLGPCGCPPVSAQLLMGLPQRRHRPVLRDRNLRPGVDTDAVDSSADAILVWHVPMVANELLEWRNDRLLFLLRLKRVGGPGYFLGRVEVERELRLRGAPGLDQRDLDRFPHPVFDLEAIRPVVVCRGMPHDFPCLFVVVSTWPSGVRLEVLTSLRVMYVYIQVRNARDTFGGVGEIPHLRIRRLAVDACLTAARLIIGIETNSVACIRTKAASDLVVKLRLPVHPAFRGFFRVNIMDHAHMGRQLACVPTRPAV